MSFMKEAIDNSMDIWEGYMSHPFIVELEDGTLDTERFKNYIIQDSLYLMDFARVYSLGMYKSKTLKEIQNFYSILGFVNADETNTRIKYLNEWGISQEEIEVTELKPANRGYTQFMLNIALTSEIPEILMATLPCMISYCYIAKRMIERNPDIKETKYWDFINDYAGGSYEDCCKMWSEYADELCKDMDEERKMKLINIFRQAGIHEMNFWDMSYEI